jgi:Fe2+ transport system protein FeoA
MLLSAFKPKQKARVLKIKGKRELKDRLMRMGLVPGEIIEVVRIAPLGSPIDVLVKGYHLSLRKEEAECIEVEIS